MSKNVITYPIIIHPENNQYQIRIPDFNGKTWLHVDTIETGIELSQKFIAEQLKNQNSYPIPMPLSQINVEDPDIKTIINVDLNRDNQQLTPNQNDKPDHVYIVVFNKEIDSVYANIKDALAKIATELLSTQTDDEPFDYQLVIKSISHLNIDVNELDQ